MCMVLFTACFFQEEWFGFITYFVTMIRIRI